MTAGIRWFLTSLGALTARPVTFFAVLGYALAWFVFARDTLEWHGVATLATWVMTIIIQRAEHRDTQAIHTKLDHLLEKIEATDSRVARVDKMEPEDIEKLREKNLSSL